MKENKENKEKEMPKREFEEQVKRGIRLLDSRVPNWREKINKDYLNMSSCKNCIVGQVYEEYFYGIEILEIDYRIDEDKDYGFFANWRDSEALKSEWILQLSK